MILNDTRILFGMMFYVGEAGFFCFGRSRYAYRVAKTHRMPGRVASGGALSLEPAACQRGRTPLHTDFSRFVSPFLPHLF